MQFSDTSSPYNGIIQNQERESKLGLGTISGNAAPNYWLAYFLGKTNEWLHMVNHWIHEINDEWIYDDVNNTGTIPEEYTPTDDTQSYSLDSDITKIRKVEGYSVSSSAWYDLDYYYESDRLENLYGQTKNTISKYFIQGRNLIFDVPVDITKTSKYRITYDRQAHEFVIGDITATPGFDKQFHWLLVYGPVMDWAAGKYPDIYNACRIKIFGAGDGDPNALKTMLQEHYQKQNRDMKYILKREEKSYD